MSTAYWLQQLRPDLSVVVIEARGVSSGATGRNGGIICPTLNDDYMDLVKAYGVESANRLIEFDHRNVEALKEFLKQHGDNDKGWFDPELTWQKQGMILAWASPEEATESRIGAERLAETYSEYKVLSAEEIREITKLDAYCGGLQIKTAGVVWAAKIVFCLARAVQNHARIVTHTHVDHVKRVGNLCQVHTSRGVIEAGRVAYCTNGWTRDLLQLFQNHLAPVRNQVLSFRASPTTPKMDFLLSANRGYQYMSQRPNGDIIMGGMRDTVGNKQQYEDDDSTINLTVSNALRQHMRDTIKVSDVPDREWTGVMGFSMRDGFPFVGELHTFGMDRQFIAAGFTGHGMPRTFLSGRALAQLLTDQPLDDWFPEQFLVQHPSREYLHKESKI
ncbi:hypothetical protein EC973_005258 [Apophysomyces ossiformis]|uniref:FAD dependent oxidoreductase domain-containing protein n=1 Tax=Apophysomyces ossiformis TaxID=679940 RepID=A0A8H7BW52_9FUNG|nr:hypothetical protein EC973_005258 [Apophysomyces ossiformis]